MICQTELKPKWTRLNEWVQKNRIYCAVLQSLFMLYWIGYLAKFTDALVSTYIFIFFMGWVSLLSNLYEDNDLKVHKEQVVMHLFALLSSLAVILANYYKFPHKLNMVLVFVGGFIISSNIFKALYKKICRMPAAPPETEIRKTKERKIFLAALLAITVLNLAFLFFCEYPGNLTPDSYDQIHQCLSGHYTDHHPFWHTMIIKGCLSLGSYVNGTLTAGIVLYNILQILFMSGCFALAVATVYRVSGSQKLAWFMLLWYALMPYNISYSITMWKDVPFGVTVLLFLTILFRIFNKMGDPKFPAYLLLTAGGLGTALFRHNGWYALLAFTLILIVTYRKKYLKLVYFLISILVFSWGLNYTAVHYLKVAKIGSVESLSIPIQQVARVIVDRKPISGEQYDDLNKIIDVSQIGKKYRRGLSDPMKWSIDQKVFDKTQKTYLSLWFKLGLKYPKTYVKAWIDQTKGYWNGGYTYWKWQNFVRRNDLGLAKTVPEPHFKKLSDVYFNFCDNNAFFSPLVSIGLFFWSLCLFAGVNYLRKNDNLFINGLLVIMIIFTLLIATPVFSEFRYAYALFTVLPAYMALTIYNKG